MSKQWLFGAFCMLAAASAVATSYVPMTDADLLAQSPLVVSGQVSAVRATRIGGAHYTDYDVAIERVAKGALRTGTITVRVVGSLPGSRSGVLIDGMPVYAANDRGAWFLERRRDGTYGILQYVLGAFHERPTLTGETVLVRDMGDVVAFNARAEVRDGPRSRDRFLDWVAARSAGRAASASYFVDPSTVLRTAEAPYTFLNATRPRWFEFDEGRAVKWVLGAKGYVKRNGNRAGNSRIRESFDVWNADTSTNIQYGVSGVVENPAYAPCTVPNAVVWEDPGNNIAGSYSCESGGILAVGGPCYGDSRTYNGRTHSVIFAADVVTQNGAGCFFDKYSGANAAQVFTHELGHTLGLGHSCGDNKSPDCDVVPNAKFQAIMRAYAHNDDRGGKLSADDRNAIRSLYTTPVP